MDWRGSKVRSARQGNGVVSRRQLQCSTLPPLPCITRLCSASNSHQAFTSAVHTPCIQQCVLWCKDVNCDVHPNCAQCVPVYVGYFTLGERGNMQSIQVPCALQGRGGCHLRYARLQGRHRGSVLCTLCLFKKTDSSHSPAIATFNAGA